MALLENKKYPGFFHIEHPLIHHKLAYLRAASTSTKKFKELVHEITVLLAYEATKELPLEKRTVQGAFEKINAKKLYGKKPFLLPILRAGLGMVDGFLELMPSSRVGHIGMYRDEKTLQPHHYYYKVPPNSHDRQVYILDPMLATGGSASDAVSKVKSEGITNLVFVCIVAAPEGVKYFKKNHPDVKIIAAALDRELNKDGYILPGLGDAGDRLFGTK